MPRFHLNIRCCEALLPDCEGRDLKDVEEALNVAVSLAVQLTASDNPLSARWRECTIQVTEEKGGTILEVPMADVTDTAGIRRLARRFAPLRTDAPSSEEFHRESTRKIPERPKSP
jgi:hypothetical protein